MATDQTKKNKPKTNPKGGQKRSKPVEKKLTNQKAKSKPNQQRKPHVKKTPGKQEALVKTVQDIKVCGNCHEHNPVDIKSCPNCDNHQKDNSVVVIIVILCALLLATLVFGYFYNREEEYETEFTAELISYDELMRNSEDLLNNNVKVMGSVTTFDFVSKTMTIDSNVFPVDGKQYPVLVGFSSDEEIDFMIGDMIIVYGYFKSMEDNIPFISAKHMMIAN